MKKRYWVLGSIIVILVIFGWLGYKTFLYLKCKLDVLDLDMIFDNIKDLKITTNKELANTQIGDMYIYIPEKLILDLNGEYQKNDQYHYYKLENNTEKYFNLSVGLDNDYSIDTFVKTMDDISNRDILDKYNIQDEIDLMRYYESHRNDKLSIFTPISDLKLHHFMKLYLMLSISQSSNCNYLTGDLKGYFYYSQYGYSAIFVNDNNMYRLNVFSLQKEITYDEVIEILESIYFE